MHDASNNTVIVEGRGLKKIYLQGTVEVPAHMAIQGVVPLQMVAMTLVAGGSALYR